MTVRYRSSLDAKGESGIYQADANTGDVRKVTGGGLMSQVSFDGDARTAVVLTTPPDSAGDLHYVDITSGAVKQLTDIQQRVLRGTSASEIGEIHA